MFVSTEVIWPRKTSTRDRGYKTLFVKGWWCIFLMCAFYLHCAWRPWVFFSHHRGRRKTSWGDRKEDRDWAPTPTRPHRANRKSQVWQAVSTWDWEKITQSEWLNGAKSRQLETIIKEGDCWDANRGVREWKKGRKRLAFSAQINLGTFRNCPIVFVLSLTLTPFLFIEIFGMRERSKICIRPTTAQGFKRRDGSYQIKLSFRSTLD